MFGTALAFAPVDIVLALCLSRHQRVFTLWFPAWWCCCWDCRLYPWVRGITTSGVAALLLNACLPAARPVAAAPTLEF